MQLKSKLYVICAIMSAVLLSGTSQAQEFRIPVMSNVEAYDFDPKDIVKHRFSVSHEYYSRQAHQCFTEHGTGTAPLTTLIFNKDEFRMSQIFQNALVPQDTEFYNPYVRVLKIKPRAYYYEHGANLTFSFDKELLHGKGRFGVRVNIPFKSVEFERKDVATRRDQQTEDVSLTKKRKLGTDGSQQRAYAYRLDFLEAMPMNVEGTPALAYGELGVALFDGIASLYSDNGVVKAGAGLIVSPEGYAPKSTNVGISETAVDVPDLKGDLSNIQDGQKYVFAGNIDYSSLSDAANHTVAERTALQDTKARIWLVTAHDEENGTINPDSGSGKVKSEMPQLVESFNSNVYEWLFDKGYEFKSDKRTGFGDIDVEVYYSHLFDDRLQGYVSAVAKLPTGTGRDYSANPYVAILGNGEHYGLELKTGGSFEIKDWICFTADVGHTFVFSAEETLCATPSGSLIKNIGQAEKADVSWEYFTGDLKLHFAHPRSRDISAFVGYQLYSKTTDSITFKNNVVESWLGKKYGTTDYTVAHNVTVDSALAAANTQRIAHRLMYGMTYHVTDWFTCKAGGAYSFAGKYAPQDMDFFGGFAVAF